MVASFQEILAATKTDQNIRDLKHPRNLDRAAANTAVQCGVIGAAIVTAIATPFTYLDGTLLVTGVDVATNRIRHVTGLSDMRTKSIRILSDFGKALDKIDHEFNPEPSSPQFSRSG